MNCKFYVIALLLFFAPVTASAQIASGGAFTLEKSVAVAGGESVNGVFSVVGTSGQNSAGINSQTAPFAVQNGFWMPAALAPTSATVIVSGRVLTADGRGVRSALVTLTDAAGATRTVLTGSFGYFSFTETEVGTCIISVSSKRFVFAVSTQIVTVNENISDINFIAEE